MTVMTAEAIVIRPASLAEVDEIWRLLHDKSLGWSRQQVVDEIGRLYVMRYGDKLIGVLNGSFAAGKEMVSWVAVHPMFPENTLGTAMISGLWGILCRRPAGDPRRAGREIPRRRRIVCEGQAVMPILEEIR
jgi:hypothetical protein